MNLRNRSVHELPGMILGPYLLRITVSLVLMLSGAARSEDSPRFETEAPPNDALLKHVRGGAFFVSKSMKEKYEMLRLRLQSLQADLDAGRVGGADALRVLQILQTEVETLRKEINQQKVLVSPVKIYRQSETTLFDLGPARLLVITADNIRVEGWNGPQVKCVLEKSVLAPEGKPVDDHFRSIKLVHRHGEAPSVVGSTQAERDTREKEFLTSPDGQKLNEQQRADRRDLIRRIAYRYEVYRPFEGKQIDTLDIEGLTYEQGNRNVSIDIRSTGGQSSSSSVWQRDAALTLYVPACQAVALRGCLVNLDVQGVHAALIVTGDGSRDCDYDGHFQVRDLDGSLTVENAPLDLVSTIHGSVSIRSTVEYANTEQRHEQAGVTFYMPPSRALTCRNIDGDLTVWFTRVALKLEKIAGRIDVKNEFGDTKLEFGERERLVAGARMPEKAQRVISESGGIEVHIAPQLLRQLPLVALTSCGSVRITGGDNLLHDTNFTVGQDGDGTSRNWRGVLSGSDGRELWDRVAAALQGRERPSGLDLISRCGTVRVFCENGNQSAPAK